MTTDNKSEPEPPTVNDLSDRLYEVIADGIDNVFRVYFKGADVITDDRFFRINSGLPHPMANLMITWKQNEIEILTEGIEPYSSDAFPSGVLCLGDVGGEAESLLKDRGFQLAEAMPAMAVELQNLAEATLGNDYTFRKVGPEEHDLWVDAFAKGYELPREFAERIGPAHAASVANGDERSIAIISCFMATSPYPRRWISYGMGLSRCTVSRPSPNTGARALVDM